MDNISTDYFAHDINPRCQTEAHLLLASTGLLNSVSGKYKIYIASSVVENINGPEFENFQRFTMIATIGDKNQAIKTMDAMGSPNQCYKYFSDQFSRFLATHDDEIYLTRHDGFTFEELSSGR
jgi:Tol biopolymer transport system component